MKRRALHSIVLALWWIALLATTWVHAAAVAPAGLPQFAAVADPAIRFDPSSSTVDPGATFVVDVVVDNVVDLGGYDFTVTFDPAVVHVLNVTLGSFLGSTGRSAAPLGPSMDNAAGKFTFGGFSFGSAPGPNGTGTVAHVTLQAMASGGSSLTFTKAQFTDTQVPIGVVLPTTIPGSVTVSGAAGTPTPTLTRTNTPTPTRTALPEPSRTPTATGGPTLTHTPVVPTATATEQATLTPSRTPTTPALTPTHTPTDMPTATPTVTLTPTSRRYWIYLPVVIRGLP